MNQPLRAPRCVKPPGRSGSQLQEFGAREPAEFDSCVRGDGSKTRRRARGRRRCGAALPSAPALAALALKQRLPSCGWSDFATAGGLMSYGVDFPDLFRRAATFVVKILKGANPVDLPVEQATKVEPSSTSRPPRRSA